MDNGSGAVGEDAAADYLAAKGYRIVERNYRTRFGEIDIIAESGQYILFTEIKTRQKDSMVSPFEAVTPAKQRRITKTALLYLQTHRVSLQPRFDVIGITMSEDGGSVQTISHLENAFAAKGFL